MSETNTPQNCAHCGDPCLDDSVWLEEKPFCCVGCKTVFEILDANNLCDYYEIDQPNLKVEQTNFGEKFAFLDNEEIADQLYKFKEGNQRMLRFFVPNIHCSSCIWLLENLNRLVEGVISTQVNFVKKEVTINFDAGVSSLRDIVEMMASVGYPPSINLAGNKSDAAQKAKRTLLIKLGVAGFCFGNIMLMSFPEYFSYQFKDEANYIRLFAWLNLIFSLPVVFYSGTEYFVSAYKGLKHRIVNIDVPISIGILVLFLRSAFEIITDTGAGYIDSLSGLVFFLLIGKWFQHKTYSALSFERDYKSYFPLAVTRIKNEKEESILVNQLQKGDEILLRNQELVPADSVLVSEQAKIDYSFVTGESEPISKQKGAAVFAGGRYLGSNASFIIQEKVSQSYLTDLWNQSAFQSGEGPALSTLVDKISQYFTGIILAISIITATFWYFTAPELAIETFTAVLIIACPCALALALPFALGNAIRRLGKNGFFLKSSETIEQLAKVDTVVFDKTGTLTENNKQRVQFFAEQALTDTQKEGIVALSKNSTHPLSKAIYSYLKPQLHTKIKETLDYKEVVGQGISGLVSGVVIKMGSAKWLDVKHDSQIPTVHVSFGNEYLGYFTVQKSKRTGTETLLNTLKDRGLDIHLVSGDNSAEAGSWTKTFGDDRKVLFNQSPQDKLEYLSKLNAAGKTTLMIGDGLNDAGALKEATVGVSISEDVYAFSPACDAILDANEFKNLFAFIQFSKNSIKVVKRSFVVSFLYNIVGLSFAVQGLLTPIVAAILMPLSSITIVLFVTIGVNGIRLKASN